MVLNLDLGLYGTTVLMAPDALSVALSNEIPCSDSGRDQFVDASGTAALLLPSLESFGVKIDHLKQALAFSESVSPLEDEDWLWRNRLVNLAEQLTQIPKGPFHQAVHETCSAFPLNTADVDTVRQGAAMVFSKILPAPVQAVETQSIPFKPEVDPSRLLPALVTQQGELRLFSSSEDLIAFFKILYWEAQTSETQCSNQSSMRCKNWDGEKYSVRVTQFISRGRRVFETEDEMRRLTFEEWKALPPLPPYTYVTVQYYPKGVGYYVEGKPQRCIYVVYLFDAAGCFQSVRISAVTRTIGDSFGGGAFRNAKTTDRRDLQIFPESN